MASYKESFTIFPRTMKSGKKIFYYQVNLPNGKRSSARSTGKMTKTEARAYCYELEKNGCLVQSMSSHDMLFKDYFKDWWVWGNDPTVPSVCPYLTRQYFRNRKPSYTNSIITYNKYKRHIEPFFGIIKLNSITPEDIEKWLDYLAQQGLSGKTQVGLMSTLRIMLKEAKRKKDIEHNPILEVIPPSKNKPKKRGILTISECERLFNLDKIDEIWNGELRAIGFFLLARDTAMRPGELRGLQKKHIHFNEDSTCSVDIHQAVDHVSHLIKETKTGAILDNAPVRQDTTIILRNICLNCIDQNTIIFSKDGRTHISEKYYKRRLYKAMQNIGISEDERKERNITPYSFRNLAITRLRQSGISDLAVRSLARHKTMIMTDGYTSFNDGESLNQIREIYF